jgi:acylphosphatase
MLKAIRMVYEGKVQGVGFRYSVKQIAAGFDATGYVRNLSDGTVELVVQGEEGEIQALLDEVGRSHLKGFIRRATPANHDPDPALRGFQIR